MKKKRMFPLNFGEHNNSLANMEYEDTSSLWHPRYGHLNFHCLKILTSQALVSSFLNVEEKKEIYEGCAKGKHPREKFSKDNKWRAHHHFILFIQIFVVLCKQRVWVESSHFLTFIDDYLKKCWVYFLKAKDEALDTFKRFKALA